LPHIPRRKDEPSDPIHEASAEVVEDDDDEGSETEEVTTKAVGGDITPNKMCVYLNIAHIFVYFKNVFLTPEVNIMTKCFHITKFYCLSKVFDPLHLSIREKSTLKPN